MGTEEKSQIIYGIQTEISAIQKIYILFLKLLLKSILFHQLQY